MDNPQTDHSTNQNTINSPTYMDNPQTHHSTNQNKKQSNLFAKHESLEDSVALLKNIMPKQTNTMAGHTITMLNQPLIIQGQTRKMPRQTSTIPREYRLTVLNLVNNGQPLNQYEYFGE
ncbi:hypothetical protein CHS0354_027579 [Potamilus streckersoni]|uniref:Uncharacterized protein n=1 Tax=Potamilus streckersoni TaxID=2493646 RepID=A0AAE0S3J5_9BIVA|nr:hypothetical protein CHS0354_027579 [Potamilus streckersoni]